MLGSAGSEAAIHPRYERIPIGLPGLSQAEAARLRRFDERHAEREGETVFDWTRLSFVVAREHVGVVQIPGLVVEILPKTDEEAREAGAQGNLLYMLETAGWVKPVIVRWPFWSAKPSRS
jgi:hypothetical protein